MWGHLNLHQDLCIYRHLVLSLVKYSNTPDRTVHLLRQHTEQYHLQHNVHPHLNHLSPIGHLVIQLQDNYSHLHPDLGLFLGRCLLSSAHHLPVSYHLH